MPKINDSSYGRAGGARDQDLQPSARTKLKKDLKQLGFGDASSALSPKKNDHFSVRASQGSFSQHLGDMFFIKRHANHLAKMVGNEPDQKVEAEAGAKTDKPVKRGIWKDDHKNSGRLGSAEGMFKKMLDDLLGKMKQSFDSLIYKQDFDMVTLKNMDPHTISMYMAKAEADIAEITQIYSQLMMLLPRLEGADEALRGLNELAAEIAKMRGSLDAVHRVLRQESMTIRAGDKQAAAPSEAGPPPEDGESPLI